MKIKLSLVCCWSPAVSSRWGPAHLIITSARTRVSPYTLALPRNRVSLYPSKTHKCEWTIFFVSLSLCRILYFLLLKGEGFFLYNSSNILLDIFEFFSTTKFINNKNIFSFHNRKINKNNIFFKEKGWISFFWKFPRANLSALTYHCKNKILLVFVDDIAFL